VDLAREVIFEYLYGFDDVGVIKLIGHFEFIDTRLLFLLIILLRNFDGVGSAFIYVLNFKALVNRRVHSLS